MQTCSESIRWSVFTCVSRRVCSSYCYFVIRSCLKPCYLTCRFSSTISCFLFFFSNFCWISFFIANKNDKLPLLLKTAASARITYCNTPGTVFETSNVIDPFVFETKLACASKGLWTVIYFIILIGVCSYSLKLCLCSNYEPLNEVLNKEIKYERWRTTSNFKYSA